MSMNKIDIVGGGLVGPLAALFLAKAGMEVALYERRADPRARVGAEGRSINLAINARGFKALDEMGLKADVMELAIPMRGRMLHDEQSVTTSVPYGREGEAIYSVSRGALNACMNLEDLSLLMIMVTIQQS